MLEHCQGTVVVQDPFHLDFCVTKAYMSTAWRHCCSNASKIASKWIENGKGGLISKGIFNLVPSSRKSNYSRLFHNLEGFQLLDLIITELKSHMIYYDPMPLIGWNNSIQTGDKYNFHQWETLHFWQIMWHLSSVIIKSSDWKPP